MKLPKVTPAAEALFAKLLALDDRLEPRKMFGQPAAFVQGNMCLGAFGEDVFLRLSPEDHGVASKISGTRPFEPMRGRPMRQYLVFPPAVLNDRTQSCRWVERSVTFTRSLPAKRTKARR